mmetsp:Transcript_32033/g.124736  ORF Transcript_32033/g.124736 Transcript_32033/m.124736 type:complete len:445 (+) Transcript_32033:912-2246(+)
MSELGFEENHAVQTMLSVSFVYVPLSGSPRLAFHYPEPLSEINSDGGMSDGSAGSLGDSSRVHSLPRAFFADFLCAKLQLCDAVMDITIDRLRFIGYPLLLPSSNPNSKPDRTVQHDIKSFNVVFTVNRSELLKNRGPLHMPTACSRASKVIGIALRYEEMRCGYLSEQVELLKTGSFSHNQASSSQCNLSMVLTETFESLRSSLITRVFVNGWLEVSLPPPYEPIEPSDREPIRPYQTMLPIDSDVSKLEALLPRGTSQVVRTLLREANPCKSFQDLEVEIDIPLETLLMAAGTLVEWHLGIISETISKHNVYVVSPTADIAVGSPLYFEFEKFSGNVRDRRWSLPGLLLQFSAPQTLEKHRTALGVRGRPLQLRTLATKTDQVYCNGRLGISGSSHGVHCLFDLAHSNRSGNPAEDVHPPQPLRLQRTGTSGGAERKVRIAK